MVGTPSPGCREPRTLRRLLAQRRIEWPEQRTERPLRPGSDSLLPHACP